MKRTQRTIWSGVGAILAAVLIAGPAGAEVEGVHGSFTPYAGYTYWDGNTNIADSPLAGARLALHFSRFFGIEADYGFIPGETLFGPLPYVTTGGVSDADLHHFGGQVFMHLFPSFLLNPYVLVGYHDLEFNSNAGPKESFNGPDWGGGVKIALGPRVGLRLEAKDVMFSFDAPPAANDTKNNNLFVSGGLEFAFGGRVHVKDADQDGVANKKDACPDTPLGALVDVNGCPLDGDKDGVWDGLDQCANTPTGATVDGRGCPSDADGDGVLDGLDRCANTPAGVKVDATGCPLDADKDGVPDGIDQCANTPSGAKVDAAGCPLDEDKDGVFDGLDKCPGTPAMARVDVDGCPIMVSEKEIELLDTGKITLKNVRFNVGKADILPESEPILDEVGSILVNWPDLKIEVGGHTDSDGSEKSNQDLSSRRAQSVLDYLLQKFPRINASQYTTQGYGESQPVVPNATKDGKAQNRRVEFKVLNTEVLKKEREKRRMLEKQ